MENTLALLLVILLSYIVGSIPTAVIVSKRFFGYDIREKGSGNMGSTNAFRLLGWKWGLFVQIVDILKGVAAVLVVANLVGREFEHLELFQNHYLIQIIAGITSVLGHIFSVFVKFKGGKGINTAAGMLLAIAPIDFGITAFAFALVLSFSGIISLSSLISSAVLPLSMLFRKYILDSEVEGFDTLIYFFTLLTILIFYTHRTNIKRLIAGNENKFPKLQIFKFGKKA